MKEGWKCPQCGTINAPWMPSCDCKKQGLNLTTIYGCALDDQAQLIKKDVKDLPLGITFIDNNGNHYVYSTVSGETGYNDN